MNKKKMTEPQTRLRTDALISKVNNRLHASLWTLRGNHYITITGRKKSLWTFLSLGPEFLLMALSTGTG